MLLRAGWLDFEMQYTSAVLERYVESIKMGKCHNFKQHFDTFELCNRSLVPATKTENLR
jgi:hypothetical protein